MIILQLFIIQLKAIIDLTNFIALNPILINRGHCYTKMQSVLCLQRREFLQSPIYNMSPFFTAQLCINMVFGIVCLVDIYFFFVQMIPTVRDLYIRRIYIFFDWDEEDAKRINKHIQSQQMVYKVFSSQNHMEHHSIYRIGRDI